MKTTGSLAYFFSLILHPFLMVFYSIVLLYTYTTFFDYNLNAVPITISVLLFTVIVPVIFLVLLKQLKLINSYTLDSKEERVLPYLMMIIANSILIYYFYNTSSVYIWLIGLIAAPTISMLFGFVINFFWKICTHTLGMGALIGSIFSLCYNVKGLNPFVLYIILFILAGCLGVSRLYLQKETPAQVYLGFILGFIISFIAVWFSILLVMIL